MKRINIVVLILTLIFSGHAIAITCTPECTFIVKLGQSNAVETSYPHTWYQLEEVNESNWSANIIVDLKDPNRDSFNIREHTFKVGDSIQFSPESSPMEVYSFNVLNIESDQVEILVRNMDVITESFSILDWIVDNSMYIISIFLVLVTMLFVVISIYRKPVKWIEKCGLAVAVCALLLAVLGK